MNKKTQRIIVIIVAAALLLSVMLPVLSVFAQASVTQSDIQGIKKRAERHSGAEEGCGGQAEIHPQRSVQSQGAGGADSGAGAAV